jgi:hypothetical protein
MKAPPEQRPNVLPFGQGGMLVEQRPKVPDLPPAAARIPVNGE